MTNYQDNDTLRIEAFSDGVFAIDITLLTLDLKPPILKNEFTITALARAMGAQWPSYLAFFISFATIYVVWVNHHRMYNVIRKSDKRFLFINGALLILVTLIPYTTGVLAKFINTEAMEFSCAIYLILFALISMVFRFMWQHAARNFQLLKRPSMDVRVKVVEKSHLIATTIYTLAAGLAFLNPYVSLGIGLLTVSYIANIQYEKEPSI